MYHSDLPNGPNITGIAAKSKEDSLAVEPPSGSETSEILALDGMCSNGSDLSGASPMPGYKPPSLELSSSNDISSSMSEPSRTLDSMPPPYRDPPSTLSSSLARPKSNLPAAPS